MTVKRFSSGTTGITHVLLTGAPQWSGCYPPRARVTTILCRRLGALAPLTISRFNNTLAPLLRSDTIGKVQYSGTLSIDNKLKKIQNLENFSNFFIFSAPHSYLMYEYEGSSFL